MKLYIRAMVSVVLFAAVSLVSALHAQSETEVRINVPFAFNCNAHHFAPGTYTLDFLSPDLMLLRMGQEGKNLIVFREEDDLDPAKSGYAAFTKIGDRYFLDGVWVQGHAVHVSINERKWEKRAAVELALEGRAPTRVELALLDGPQSTTR